MKDMNAIEISARQLSDGMLRRQVSPKQLAREKGLSESTIRKWMVKGVPAKHANTIKDVLIETEKKEYGGEHIQMFKTDDDVL